MKLILMREWNSDWCSDILRSGWLVDKVALEARNKVSGKIWIISLHANYLLHNVLDHTCIKVSEILWWTDLGKIETDDFSALKQILQNRSWFQTLICIWTSSEIWNINYRYNVLINNEDYRWNNELNTPLWYIIIWYRRYHSRVNEKTWRIGIGWTRGTKMIQKTRWCFLWFLIIIQ